LSRGGEPRTSGSTPLRARLRFKRGTANLRFDALTGSVEVQEGNLRPYGLG